MAARKSTTTETTDAYRAAEITERVNQLGDDFQKRDELYRTIDKAVHSEYGLNVPEAYQATAMEIRTPLAMNIVNTVTAALSVNPPSVNCEPLTRGLKGQQNAEKREHFFEASWARQESDSRRPLLRLFMGSLVAKGEGVLKTVERSKAAWGEYRAQSKRLLQDLTTLDDGVDQEAMTPTTTRRPRATSGARPTPSRPPTCPPSSSATGATRTATRSAPRWRRCPTWRP